MWKHLRRVRRSSLICHAICFLSRMLLLNPPPRFELYTRLRIITIHFSVNYQMEKEGFVFTEITYCTILNTLSKAGEKEKVCHEIVSFIHTFIHSTNHPF